MDDTRLRGARRRLAGLEGASRPRAAARRVQREPAREALPVGERGGVLQGEGARHDVDGVQLVCEVRSRPGRLGGGQDRGRAGGDKECACEGGEHADFEGLGGAKTSVVLCERS